MKNILSILTVLVVLITSTLPSIKASEVNVDQQLVDACSTSSIKVNSQVYTGWGVHPSFKIYTNTEDYWINNPNDGITATLTFSTKRVATTVGKGGGYGSPIHKTADGNRDSRIEVRAKGDIYKVTDQSCNVTYRLKNATVIEYKVVYL